MAEPKRRPNAFLDRLNLIYYALLSVSLILFLYTYLEETAEAQAGGPRGTALNYDTDPTLAWSVRLGVGLLALVDTAAGFLLFRRQLAAIDKRAPLDEKLARYRRAFLVQVALYASAMLLVAVFYYFSGDEVFAFLYVIVLLISASARPSLHALRTRLALTQEETRQLSATDVVT
ncbi:MAG: hypothetical protein WBA12_10775 [Catalinimonas sp.]